MLNRLSQKTKSSNHRKSWKLHLLVTVHMTAWRKNSEKLVVNMNQMIFAYLWLCLVDSACKQYYIQVVFLLCSCTDINGSDFHDTCFLCFVQIFYHSRWKVCVCNWTKSTRHLGRQSLKLVFAVPAAVSWWCGLCFCFLSMNFLRCKAVNSLVEVWCIELSLCY